MIPAHFWVGAEDASRVGLVLHGVLGAGHNLRSFVKRLTEARPEYRFLLVDLRNHGKSQGAAPPHTLEAAVDDLLELNEHLGIGPEVVIGHSLGGKVSLLYGKRRLEPGSLRPLDDAGQERLRQIWALDSDPGAQEPGGSHQVRSVVSSLEANPGPFPSRAAAVEALQSSGLSSGLANWLSTNLERQGEGVAWRLDLAAIHEMLDDYFSSDLWGFLEQVARGEFSAPVPDFHLLVAENSDRWSGSMKERAEALPRGGSFHLHELSDSGHWVHVDNPDGLLAIISENLP